MKNRVFYSLFICTLVILLGCSDRKFDNPALQENDLADQNADLQQGWELLANGDLEAALVKFETVLKQDPKHVDAHVGTSSIYLAKDDFPKAIDFSKMALENASAQYVFSFDPTINKDSIHLTLAQAYYYAGDFNQSNDQVRQLTGQNVTLSPVSLIEEIERLGKE
jgi:tetratricopeptide (TPR) repeat protein